MAKKETKQVEETVAFDAQLNKAESFIKENLKKLTIALAAVVVLVVGIWAYTYWQGQRETKAQNAIAASQELFMQENYELALNGNENSVGFLQVMDQYSGTKTANLAKLYAAICYAKADKYEDAIKMAEDFSGKGDQMVSPAAIAALANCYIQTGQNDKGVELLIKAAKKADNDAISPSFLLQAATVLEADGNNEKAVELYTEIKTKYINSPLADQMDAYIIKATK